METADKIFSPLQTQSSYNLLSAEDNFPGCDNAAQEIYLIDNNGVWMQQIAQWFILIVLPVTTVIFVCAGLQAQRTHGFSFDSIVLYLCAFYNLFYLFEDFVKCSEAGQLIKICYMTGMILYLIFNFEEMLTDMEREIDEIREQISNSPYLPVINERKNSALSDDFNTPTQQLLTTTQQSSIPRRPSWRKCRRPYFWISVAVMFVIMVDAIFEQFSQNSMLDKNHWIAMRVLDLILSISVFLQSKKLENLLDEKEEILGASYKKGRLSSPFILMRRKQLRMIAISYMVGNMLIIVQMSLLFGVKSPQVSNCATLCAVPLSNGAAVMLWTFALINLTPTHFFIYSFYIIPRRFYASEADDMKLLEDANGIRQPLVEAYLVEDEMDWQRSDSRGPSRQGSNIRINTGDDVDSVGGSSSFQSRLLNRRITPRDSFKKRDRKRAPFEQNDTYTLDIDNSYSRVDTTTLD